MVRFFLLFVALVLKIFVLAPTVYLLPLVSETRLLMRNFVRPATIPVTFPILRFLPLTGQRLQGHAYTFPVHFPHSLQRRGGVILA